MTGLWNYRSLIIKLAVTDLKIRYKNSVLGLLWSLLQPMLMLLVLYIVFTRVMVNVNESLDPYPLFLLLGIISWGFLDKATGFSLHSIVGKPSLIKKVYFPREVLVISACLTALMMTCIELTVFAAFMLAYGIMPTAAAMLFPPVLFVEFVLALGISLAIASLNVRYRDVQWIWAVIMQAGFFATPILFSISIFGSTGWLRLLTYNPVGVIMTMMRDTLIYGRWPVFDALLLACLAAAAFLVIGVVVFRHLEPSFAEEV